jgi:hypothetical protein
VKREPRHVRTAVTAYLQLHTEADSAMRGEVLEVLGQAAQNAASPAILAMRNLWLAQSLPDRFRLASGGLFWLVLP